MATEYRLTAEAEDDLQGIADYTFETFGPAQAEAYGLGLRSCFATLVDNPFLGPDYGSLRPGLRRYEHESHSVFYGWPEFSSCACCTREWTRRGIFERNWEHFWLDWSKGKASRRSCQAIAACRA
jgi:toxin ParE1/3/4